MNGDGEENGKKSIKKNAKPGNKAQKMTGQRIDGKAGEKERRSRREWRQCVSHLREGFTHIHF